jgi:uncharacterized membrane protein
MAFLAGLSLFYVHKSLVATLAFRQGSPAWLAPALFFGGAMVLAKGSEEVVKVLNQVFLAQYVGSDTVRATVISFTEAVTSLIGFVLINVGLVVTWTQQPQNKAPSLLLFVSCSGVVLATVAGLMLRRIVTRVPAPAAGVAD